MAMFEARPLGWVTNKDFLAKYEIIKVLGSGGQAKLYKAKLKDSNDEKYFAAKVYMPQNRFLVECEIKNLKPLDHPSTTRFIDSFGLKEDGSIDESQQTIVVVTYIDGKDLMKYFDDKKKEKKLDTDK